MNIGGIRTVGLVVALALVVGACGGGEEPETPTASVPVATAEPTTAPTEAAATEPADPFAIPEDPADIDEPYVERVLEELNLSLVDATRIVARRGKVTRRVRQILGRTHLPRARDGYIQTFEELAGQRTGVRFRRDPQAVKITSVDEIFTASSKCMFVAVTQDSSGLVKGNAPPFANYYHLRSKRPPEPTAGNATPWMVVLDSEPPPSGKEYADPCE